MSTLTDESTDAQVEAAYDNNASYSEDGSTSKAAAFITAARILIRRTLSEQMHGDARMRADENLRQYRRELDEAKSWLVAHGGGGGSRVRYKSFENFRS